MNRNQTQNWNRRQFVRSLLFGAVAAHFAVPGKSGADELSIEVWKGPMCGCCDDWITYLEANGFSVTSHNEGGTDAMTRLGMPFKFGSWKDLDLLIFNRGVSFYMGNFWNIVRIGIIGYLIMGL